MRIEVIEDPGAVAVAAAAVIAAEARGAVAARGRFAVALSGGETPRALYRMIARQQFSQKIPWRRVQLYWGDERCVPPDDPASNYGMARDAFIKHVPIADANVHRVLGEQPPQGGIWLGDTLGELVTTSQACTLGLFPMNPFFANGFNWEFIDPNMKFLGVPGAGVVASIIE